MKKFIALFVTILMICTAVSVSAAGSIAGSTPTDMIRISNDTRVRVRKEPTGESDPLGWADSGLEFPYLGTVGGWYCIDFEGMVGYISSTLGVVAPQHTGARYVTITSPNGVNIRANANSTSKQVGKADKKDIFLYKGTENGWYKILCNGKIGYVSTKLSEVSAAHEDTISSASPSSMSDGAYSIVGSTPADYVRITNNTRIKLLVRCILCY